MPLRYGDVRRGKPLELAYWLVEKDGATAKEIKERFPLLQPSALLTQYACFVKRGDKIHYEGHAVVEVIDG